MSEKLSGEFQEELTPEEIHFARVAAQITLARVENWQELWTETEQEGDEKFLQKSRELWKEFAVSGVVGRDKKTGEPVILNFTDLDGRCSLGLLGLARINTENVQYVAPSSFVEGRINLDTGDRHGMVLQDAGKTVFFDHHADESGNDVSATALVYEALAKVGLFKKQPYLDKLVEFVTQVDNRSYPGEEKYFQDSWRTVLGMQRFLQFKHLLDFFQAGRNPTEFLSPADLKGFGLEKRSQEQKGIVEASLKRLKEMEEEGLIIPSERYGKIAVDIDKKVMAGFDAAKASGCGGYIIWNPDQNSFFLSTVQPLTDQFNQGRKVRKTMWIKPLHDKTPLTIKLGEILNTMTDGSLEPSGELAKYLEKEGGQDER
jgi:hypothetical protein